MENLKRSQKPHKYVFGLKSYAIFLGAARSSTPILQNKAYWEFKLQQNGVWSCGLANPGCDLNKNLGNDLNSWALTHDNVIKINGNIEHKIEPKVQEGDIIVSIKKKYVQYSKH